MGAGRPTAGGQCRAHCGKPEHAWLSTNKWALEPNSRSNQRAMKDNAWGELDQDVIAAARRTRADLLEQVSLTKETIRQSRDLLRQADDLLARSPLKP
jgi:hypothetical protein